MFVIKYSLPWVRGSVKVTRYAVHVKTTRERFEFSLFVPGIRLPTRNGLSAPKPLGKGSLEPLKRANGSYKKTTQRHPRVGRQSTRCTPGSTASPESPYRGAHSSSQVATTRSPTAGPVKVVRLFLYERPATQRTGYPVAWNGIYAQHDLDKLQRALGDAITPTRDPNYPMGDIIEDDRWITTWAVSKRFVDQVVWAPGAGVHLHDRGGAR